MLSQLGVLFVQWFLLILFVIEISGKLYLNWDHQFGIVEDHDLYDEISQDQRGTALAVASLVFAGLAIILSDSPDQYVLQIEIFVAAFGFLLIAAFAHELTLTYRIVLTLQEMALEYGLMLMVWGIFLLIYEVTPETGPVLAIVSLAVFLFRFASLKGELEAHANE
ncbi:hypothetical protein C482_00150 [Natrialba chahannaoensis JCM 10990]|uniref:Uncharacterized protein n=1 Tax=Natrialba chahannaoensis JCM 10990 TaxID=1227492 RepID=M0B5J4_9EURY|nr:hypothetical protein [Natrialba chahannaoensis]ELZ06186.1 hypothetical protein C482_00150 [Natrialba chahannaoensis JCM 10990]